MCRGTLSGAYYSKQQPSKISALTTFALGVIQQLRGQEEGEGWSVKSPRLSNQGGGGSLECPRGPKPNYFRRHFIP